MNKDKIIKTLLYSILVFFSIAIIWSFVEDFKEVARGYVPSNAKPEGLLFLSIISFIFFWKKKMRIFLIIAWLVILTLFYFYSYNWEYVKFTGFWTQIGGLDCRNYKITHLQNSIDFYDINKAIVQQEVNMYFTNNSSTNLHFFSPENLTQYQISINGKHYNPVTRTDENITFTETNYSEPQLYYNFTGYTNDNYRLYVAFWLEDITPYGNFHFNYLDYSGRQYCIQNIESVYASVSFSDISYDCPNQGCFTSWNPNATTSNFVGIFNYVNSRSQKPSTSFSVKDTNTDFVSFRVQAVNKFFVILREFSIGVIAGLVLYFLELLFEKLDQFRYNRKKYEEF